MALARQLSEEGHSVTVVDTKRERIERVTEEFDVMGIVGNGSSINVLTEAGMQDADLLIAVTGSDEMCIRDSPGSVPNAFGTLRGTCA